MYRRCTHALICSISRTSAIFMIDWAAHVLLSAFGICLHTNKHTHTHTHCVNMIRTEPAGWFAIIDNRAGTGAESV